MKMTDKEKSDMKKLVLAMVLLFVTWMVLGCSNKKETNNPVNLLIRNATNLQSYACESSSVGYSNSPPTGYNCYNLMVPPSSRYKIDNVVFTGGTYEVEKVETFDAISTE